MRYRISQNELEYAYETAQRRMACHKEYTEKFKNIINGIEYFKTEKEALTHALAMFKKGIRCQIWAKVEKDDDVYRILNYWIVAEDNFVKQAAHYIGMALMYDEVRLTGINIDNINIDDVIAYY